ncbi:MAG: hypothetical protein DMD99_25730 [Candidatus Rokuibacteriota bacterium]|nr:MAG: hypothetical protein DMD99_25730 [Candidatus Rokubacteria bacterium]
MPTALQTKTPVTESLRNGQETPRGEQGRLDWFRAIAPLWPLGLARILYGYLWWQQSGWKVPSDDFGRKSGGGLWYWVQQQIQYPTVAAHKAFLVNVMIPHWTFFGWMVLITETFIGATLILGLGTRLASVVAIGMAANITIGILRHHDRHPERATRVGLDLHDADHVPGSLPVDGRRPQLRCGRVPRASA